MNGGVGANQGLNLQHMLGANGPGAQDVMKLLDQLKEALGLGKAEGKDGGCKNCSGGKGQEASGGAGGIEDLIRKPREMAKQNPQAVMQALNANPQLAQMLGGVASGNLGGGAGGIGSMAA